MPSGTVHIETHLSCMLTIAAKRAEKGPVLSKGWANEPRDSTIIIIIIIITVEGLQYPTYGS